MIRLSRHAAVLSTLPGSLLRLGLVDSRAYSAQHAACPVVIVPIDGTLADRLPTSSATNVLILRLARPRPAHAASARRRDWSELDHVWRDFLNILNLIDWRLARHLIILVWLNI